MEQDMENDKEEQFLDELYDMEKGWSKSGPKPETEKPDMWKGLISLEELMAEDEEEPEWLVRDVIPMESVTLLGGDSNVGKSWMCLDLFVSAQTNSKWLGRLKCKQTNVLYFMYEDSKKSARRRLGMLLRGRDKTLSDLRKNAKQHLHPLPGSQINIINKISVREIIKKAKELDAGVIVFDTLRKALGPAEENDPAIMDMAANNFNLIAKETGAAVLITHHVRKTSTTQYKGVRRVRKEDMRGSTALIGAVDAVVCLSRISGDQHNNILELFVDKQRDGIRGKLYGIGQNFLYKGGNTYKHMAMEWKEELGVEDKTLEEMLTCYNRLKDNEKTTLAGTFTVREFSMILSSNARGIKKREAELNKAIGYGFIEKAPAGTGRSGTDYYKLINDYENIVQRKKQEVEARMLSQEPVEETTWETEKEQENE